MKKVKVVHIITRMIIGGAQENTLLTVLGLQKDARYEVSLITGMEKGPEGRLELEDVENPIFESSLVRNLHPIKDIICLIKLFLFFRKNKFDIVHTHSSKAGVIGRIAAFIARVPVIIHTIHGLSFHSYQSMIQNKLFIFLEKICAIFTTRIITVADEMQIKCLKSGIGKKEQFITIYSGMKLEEFKSAYSLREDVRRKLNVSDKAFIIGKVARLFPLKGHKYILNIAEDLVKRYPQIVFVFVGNGILFDSFSKKIKARGLNKHFIFTGLVDPARIPEYLSSFDILVHTSLREGLARVLPQAGAVGVPVISFDIDGAKEVIKDGETGFLVEPENECELKEKIIELINNYDLRVKFMNNLRQRLEPYFSHKYMVREIEEVYRFELQKIKL